MGFENCCPNYKEAMAVLGKKWTCLILSSLMDGPRRFTEISNYANDGCHCCPPPDASHVLSDRLLSQRLQELEERGIVERRVHAQRPVVVEYSLTDKGRDLRGVLEAIERWADRWEPVSTA